MTDEVLDEQTLKRFMGLAIEEAKKSLALIEVPVGAVVVCDGEVVSAAYNTRETDKNAVNHAELLAIAAACKKLGGWRLHKCDLYVTLEPCPMCAGAIVQARIPKVVIGSMNPKAGCAGSVLDMLHEEGFNHQVETTIGVLGENCSAMLSEFFRDLRAKKKKQKELQKAQQALLSDDSSIESTDENAGGNGEKDLQSAADDSGQNKEE